MTPARERIIHAALTLVTEQGLNGVTMVAVADAADVARATLYNHYSDVASIVSDAAIVHNQHAIDGLRQALAVISTPDEAIQQLVRHVAAISSHGHTITSHHGFPPDLRDVLAAFDTEIEEQTRRILADGIASGDFRPDLDVATTATLLRHLLTGVSELVAAAPERAAHITDEAVRTALAAVSASGSSD